MLKKHLSRIKLWFSFILASVLVFISQTVFVFAADELVKEANLNGSEEAFAAILAVVKVIVAVVGIIFLLVGIVKFTIAHANEDGPQQQKAGMMIATGIALIVLVGLVTALKLDESLLRTVLGVSGDSSTPTKKGVAIFILPRFFLR